MIKQVGRSREHLIQAWMAEFWSFWRLSSCSSLSVYVTNLTIGSKIILDLYNPEGQHVYRELWCLIASMFVQLGGNTCTRGVAEGSDKNGRNQPPSRAGLCTKYKPTQLQTPARFMSLASTWSMVCGLGHFVQSGGCAAEILSSTMSDTYKYVWEIFMLL